MKQGGSALLLMLFVLLLGVSCWLLAGNRAAPRPEQTALALGAARDGLLSWSFARQPHAAGGNDSRPGSLPCPDLHDPDSERSGWPGSDVLETCNTAESRIGRLPWRSLGLEKLEDAAREPLWYLVAAPFHDSDNGPLNSDSSAHLPTFSYPPLRSLVDDGDRIVAVIFAPGAALSGQSRASPAERLDPRQYLEALVLDGQSFDNASANPASARISGRVEGKLNDRLIVIRLRELIAPVEARAAREYLQLLQQYRNLKGSYPDAAASDDPGCTETGAVSLTGCEPKLGNCSGRPPRSGWFATIPALERAAEERGWLQRNRWQQVLHYRVASETCALTIDGEAANGLVVSTGAALSGQNRATKADRVQAGNYLDDAQNVSGWQDSGQYRTPTKDSNDRFYRLP